MSAEGNVQFGLLESLSDKDDFVDAEEDPAAPSRLLDLRLEHRQFQADSRVQPFGQAIRPQRIAEKSDGTFRAHGEYGLCRHWQHRMERLQDGTVSTDGHDAVGIYRSGLAVAARKFLERALSGWPR
ncbi:hypothetical protein EFR01_27290 [Sinorhizobium fredii]|nr:hypothetical protein EFR01_27290 [Sinorhizobium fredii]